MLRRSLVMIFLLCLLVTALSVSGQGILGVEVTDFSEPLTDANVVPLAAYDTPFFLRAGTISPDGLRVAYLGGPNSICVIDIVTSGSPPEPSCADFLPDTGRLRVRTMQWSPDSRYVAFHEDAPVTFRDSDLMLFDTERNIILNVTNDNFLGDLMDVFQDDTGELSITLDYSPLWASDQELYFWRSVYSNADEIPTTLQRINVETLEVTEVALLSMDRRDVMGIIVRPSSLGFSNVSSISPTERFIAAYVWSSETDRIRVDVVDLETGDVRTAVLWDEILETSPMLLDNNQLLPTGIDWLPDESGLLVSAFNPGSLSINSNVFQFTFDDSRIVPLIDLSIVKSESELTEPVGGFAPVSMIPRFVTLTPDRSTIIWSGGSEGVYQFWSATLPLTAPYSPERMPHLIDEVETSNPVYQSGIGVFGGTIRVLGSEELITLSR